MNALAKASVSQVDTKLEISHVEYLYYLQQARLERSRAFHQILTTAYSYLKQYNIFKKSQSTDK